MAGRPLALTPTEFSILATLASVPGRVFRREKLLASLWKLANTVQPHTLDVHVARLRRKLADAGDSPLIMTVYGVGYRLREREAPASVT
jgi:two-component system phosphate regulon response regulator PhoB